MILALADFVALLFSSLATGLSTSLLLDGRGLVVAFGLCLGIACGIAIMYRAGLYDVVGTVISEEAFRLLLLGAAVAAATFGLGSVVFEYTLKAEHLAVYAALSLLCLVGGRLILREVRVNKRMAFRQPVLVYGAGSAGRQLVSALRAGEDYLPVAFIDDNGDLQRKKIAGMRVHEPKAIRSLLHKHGVKKILLAIPSASIKERKRVLNQLEHYQVEVKTVAGAAEIISGKVQITELKDIDIEDLLGREAAQPYPDLMRKCIAGKVVMVTGAGGSIGSELCRQIMSYDPRRLILFEVSEYALYRIDAELRAQKREGVELIPVLGSVTDRDLLERLMSAQRIDTVYHAAAYKHVPLVEFNVAEGVRNNVFGTANIAQIAQRTKVANFVLVSTDKAVRPTNFMGASKRAGELVLQALAQQESSTLFCMVRFGNVLGSSGSVVPLFKQQIAAGGPVTVTHKEITRYFMTIPEAAQLVIQAGSLSRGGDVFVLDMGDPVRIADLAERMIHLMGYEVKNGNSARDDGIEVVYTGLRPGEKLFEELLVGENVAGTVHPRIMTANESFLPMAELTPKLNELSQACTRNDVARIRTILVELDTHFEHDFIADFLWDSESSVNTGKVIKFGPPLNG